MKTQYASGPSSLKFVNLKGESVSIQAVKASARVAAVTDSFHKGWVVVGFSQAQLAEASAAHEARQRSLPDDKRQPFDEVAFMRSTKPKKVRTKPYEIHSAAKVCQELAARQGWKLVDVVPVAKGMK